MYPLETSGSSIVVHIFMLIIASRSFRRHVPLNVCCITSYLPVYECEPKLYQPCGLGFAEAVSHCRITVVFPRSNQRFDASIVSGIFTGVE